MKTPKHFIVTAVVLASSLLLVSPAKAISFQLTSNVATLIDPGNSTSTFYQVSGAGVESGTAASLYSATLGGNEDAGFFVTISFGLNPQPILTSAVLKASNSYLLWDAADLLAFNSGVFDSITLNNSGAGGIKNDNNKYQGTSHAALNGGLGTPTQFSSVPDGGSTVLLLGLACVGLGILRFKLAKMTPGASV